MRISDLFVVLLCLSSFFLVYIIFSTARFVSPWKLSLQFRQGRWSSSTEVDFHDEGVLKGEQQRWTTANLRTEKATLDKNVADESKPLSRKSGIRKSVIIVSPGRGGSSFLGEIFNINSHVMFLYEPLHTVLVKLYKNSELNIEGNEPKNYKESAIKVINSLLQCDFGDITNSTLEAISKDTSFRARSKALAGGYLFTKTLLSKVCNSSNYTVVKVLTERLPNLTIQTLKDLFNQPDRYEVKLIHLVRDPRAVMYSRVQSVKWIKSYRDPTYKEHLKALCNPILNNIRFGLISPPHWLQNRFKVIRYEDLVLNVVNMAKELYKFVEIDWSMDIEEWINEHITGKISARARKNPYSVYRNPSAVIEKWKSAPEAFIRTVEDSCGDLMNFVGYEKFTNKGK